MIWYRKRMTPSPFQSSFVVFFPQVPCKQTIEVYFVYMHTGWQYLQRYINNGMMVKFVSFKIALLHLKNAVISFSRHFGSKVEMQNIFAKHFSDSKQSFGKSRHKQLLPVTSASESEAGASKWLIWIGKLRRPLSGEKAYI